MDRNKDFIILNKATATTTKEIYDNNYLKQSLEILKLLTSFILASLMVKIIETSILDFYKDNKIIQVILMIVLSIAIYLISVELFTFIKIESDKETILKELSK